MNIKLIIVLVLIGVILIPIINWITTSMCCAVGPLQTANLHINKTFFHTNKNFTVWPDSYSLHKGEVLKALVGIINREPDSKTHSFSIFVKPPKGYEEKFEILYRPEKYYVHPNETYFIPVAIIPEKTLEKGIYLFWVYACKDMTNCSETNYNYDEPQYIRISIE